jgi:predicted kinase
MTPRLIVLNGPPAVGKSTLARRYAEDHPLAMALDLDSLRRLLGRWRDDPQRAGLLARAMSLTLAREHLAAGLDVVLPQYLGRPQFLDEAAQVAEQTGAQFREFALMDNRDEIVRRFEARTAAAVTPADVDAGWLVAQVGGRDAVFAMIDRLLLMISSRPHVQVLQCPEGSVESVYRQLLARLAG